MVLIKRNSVWGIVLLVALLMGALPGLAQDDSDPAGIPHPLIEMLSMVPAEAAVVPPDAEEITWIGYADLRANEQARPGVATPQDMATMREWPEDTQDLWVANHMRLIGVPIYIQTIRPTGHTRLGPEMVDYLGFDIFEIDRVMYLEDHPTLEIEIYAGHFDAQQVIETLVSRTYTKATSNDFPVVCGPVGCEHGDEVTQFLPDQGERDPRTLSRLGAFPIFRGDIGRQQPIAFVSNAMLSSPYWDALDAMTAAAQGSRLSIYDLPDYRAITDFAVAESADGLLIQVLYFDPTWFSAKYYAYSVYAYIQEYSEDLTSEQMIQLAEELNLDTTAWADLPLYSAVAMVDWQDGPDQVAHLVLAYDNEADAQQAAEVVTRRIPEQSAFALIGENEPVLDYIELDYTLEPGRVVYNAAADQWLAVTTLRVPLPGSEPDPEYGGIPSSGRIWWFWQALVKRYQFSPLVVLPG